MAGDNWRGLTGPSGTASNGLCIDGAVGSNYQRRQAVTRVQLSYLLEPQELDWTKLDRVGRSGYPLAPVTYGD